MPAKRKKSGENVIKAKKSKTQMKAEVVAAGGDESDSDSSLDVEKWKKMVLHMTGRCVCGRETKKSLSASFLCECAKDDVMRTIPEM